MNPWVVFFKQAFPILVEAEAAKRSANSNEDHVVDKQLTLVRANMIAPYIILLWMSQLIYACLSCILVQEVAEMMTSELKKRCGESPGVAENAICAIGALALALPLSVHSHIEIICDTLLSLFRQDVQIVAATFPAPNHLTLPCTAGRK